MRFGQRWRWIAAAPLLVVSLAAPFPSAVAAPATPRTPCTRPEQVGGFAPSRSGARAGLENRTQPEEQAATMRAGRRSPALRPSAAAAARRPGMAPQVTPGDGGPPETAEHELACSGGWSWFADPRAVHRDGRTFIGWIDFLGQVKVAAYEHDTRQLTTAVLQTRFQLDDHNNPSILVLADGRLLVFWSAHGGTELFYRRSVRPGDVTAWEPARTIATNLAGRFGFTYPNPVQLRAEGGRVWLFWRGGNFNPAFATSDDLGETWTEAGHLIDTPGHRPYVKVDSNGDDTIHLAFTDAHPRNLVTSVYYMAYRDGAFFKADGTRIGGLGDLPFRPEQTDTVYDAATAGDVRAWTHDVGFDPATGHPVVTFATFPSDVDHRYHWARWDGDHWLDVEVTRAGGAITPDPTEQLYSGGITLDHDEPSVAYLSRPVRDGGSHEIERWETTDGGHSWTTQAVRSDSSGNSFRPVSPRGLPAGEDQEVVWMEGDYPRFTEFRTALNFIGRPTGNVAPRAVFVPRAGSEPRNVKLDARAARDPDGPPPSLTWDLGDGNTTTGTRVSHTYGAPGTYTITLTATDDDRLRAVYIREVTVADPVSTALRISVSPATIEPDETVTVGGRLVRADDPTAPVAGETLQLLRRPLGSTEWETVLEQRTPGDGLIRFVDSPEQSTEYMWRFLGSARFDPSESPVAWVERLVTSTAERP